MVDYCIDLRDDRGLWVPGCNRYVCWNIGVLTFVVTHIEKSPDR